MTSDVQIAPAPVSPGPAASVTLRDTRTGAPISAEDAAARISAYVYGNIVVLATLASLSKEDADSGHAALVVCGVAVSTFLAHAIADGIGRRLRTTHPLSPRTVIVEIRDSMPVLTSATLPALLLVITALTDIPAAWAQAAAGSYLVVRLGLIGSLIARFRGVPSSRRVIGAGLALAALAAVATAAKILLGH